MPVVNSPMGRFRFPDDMPMEDIDAEMSALHAPEPPQGNNFAGALRSAFFPEQQQAPSVLPVISAPGLSPQNGDRLRGIVGQQQQLDASELLRQRATRAKEVEAEKDRQKTFQLEKLRHNNTKNELEMRLQNSLEVAKHKSAMPKLQYDYATKKWYQQHIDPETSEVLWKPMQGDQPAPKAEERPSGDYTIGNTRFSGATNKPLVTAQPQKSPYELQKDFEDLARIMRTNNTMKDGSEIPDAIIRDMIAANEQGVDVDMEGWFKPRTPAAFQPSQPRVGPGPNGEYQNIVPGAPLPDKTLSTRDRLEVKKMAREAAYEQDPDFDTKPAADKARIVKEIEDSIMADLSGPPASVNPDVPVGPTIGKPGGQFVPYGNGGGFVYTR